MNKFLLLSFSLLVVLSGCATKHYGRQGDLTQFERVSLSCREIDLELAKVEGFLQNISNESSFDGRSVASFLGDFGIGNIMKRNAAKKSAEKRKKSLLENRAAKHCGEADTVIPAKVETAPREPSPKAGGTTKPKQ